MRWNKGMGAVIQRQSVSTPERTLSRFWRGVRVSWGFCRWGQVELCLSVWMQQPVLVILSYVY